MTAPTKVGDYGVQCVHYQAPAGPLFACQAFSFGTVDPASGAFTERTKFSTVKEFVACSGADVSTACKTQLCRDYCGPGHFAQAPLCCAYNDVSCGPLVAVTETTGSPADCPAGTPGAGTAGSGAGAGGSAAVSGTGAGAGAAAGTSALSTGGTAAAAGSGARAGSGGSAASTASTAGAAVPSTPAKSSSGCGCASVTPRDRGTPWWYASALLAIGLGGRILRRRARRVPAPAL
jgi:hypothetical protein